MKFSLIKKLCIEQLLKQMMLVLKYFHDILKQSVVVFY